MNRQFILFSVMGLVLVGVSARLATANAVDHKVNEPLCYVQHSHHPQQDLTKICGQSALIPAAPVSQLDPKATVDFQMPRSRTPSAMWNSVPDSDVPIEIGKTYTPTASKPAVQPPAAAQPPLGGDDAVIDDD
jgi:hypothetical protein